MTDSIVLATDDGFVLLTDDGFSIEIGEAPNYFQRLMVRVLPPWLTRARGRRLVTSMAKLLDDIADRGYRAVALRFPSTENESALSYLGSDRRIPRGPGESAGSYASRLVPWLDAHRLRGGPYALLKQLHAYHSESPRRIDLVYASGTRFVMEPDGTITRDSITWREDSDPARWAQVWVIHHLEEDPGPLSAMEEAQYLQVVRDWDSGHILPIEVALIWPDANQLWDYPEWEITWDELDALAIPWDEIEAIKIN